jgi:flagellar protein FlbD
MIEVTRLRGSKVVLNAELIETIEETPDTVITLINGKRYVVSESSEELVDRVIEYKRKIHKQS